MTIVGLVIVSELGDKHIGSRNIDWKRNRHIGLIMVCPSSIAPFNGVCPLVRFNLLVLFGSGHILNYV